MILNNYNILTNVITFSSSSSSSNSQHLVDDTSLHTNIINQAMVYTNAIRTIETLSVTSLREIDTKKHGNTRTAIKGINWVLEEEEIINENENRSAEQYNGMITLWSNTNNQLWQSNEYHLPANMMKSELMATSTNGKVVILLDDEAMSGPGILHICISHEESITPISSIQLNRAFFPRHIQYLTSEQSLVDSIPRQLDNTQWRDAVLREEYATIPNDTIEDSHLILVGISGGIRLYGVIARYSGPVILPQFHSETRFGVGVSAVCYNPRWPHIVAAGHHNHEHSTSIWCSRTGQLLASASTPPMHVWGLEMIESLPTNLGASAVSPRIVSISEDVTGSTNITVWTWPDASLLTNDTVDKRGRTIMEIPEHLLNDFSIVSWMSEIYNKPPSVRSTRCQELFGDVSANDIRIRGCSPWLIPLTSCNISASLSSFVANDVLGYGVTYELEQVEFYVVDLATGTILACIPIDAVIGKPYNLAVSTRLNTVILHGKHGVFVLNREHIGQLTNSLHAC
jgi:hypothetical protein